MSAQRALGPPIMHRPLGADMLRWLPSVVALAAVLEMVVLRVFTRTAIHIPGFSRLRSVYVTISETGRVAFYVAAVLLIATLVLLVSYLARRGSFASLAGAAGIATFLSAAVIARLRDADGSFLGMATVVAVLLLGPWACGGWSRRSRIVRTLLVTAFLVAAMTSAGQPAPIDLSARRAWLALAAEMLAILGAIAAPLLARTRSRSALVWGAAVGVLVFATLIANPWTVKILLLWNLGLAGYLPSVLYASAAGALTWTVISLFSERRMTSAVGILLLFAGGIGLHSTYQTGLVLAGLALLGTEAHGEEAPTWDGEMQPHRRDTHVGDIGRRARTVPATVGRALPIGVLEDRRSDRQSHRQGSARASVNHQHPSRTR